MLSCGSRIMRSDPIDGCENISLWDVRLSVAPAKGEYSPPDREVGMLMTGIIHGFRFGVLAVRHNLARPSNVETLFAKA